MTFRGPLDTSPLREFGICVFGIRVFTSKIIQFSNTLVSYSPDFPWTPGKRIGRQVVLCVLSVINALIVNSTRLCEEVAISPGTRDESMYVVREIEEGKGLYVKLTL